MLLIITADVCQQKIEGKRFVDVKSKFYKTFGNNKNVNCQFLTCICFWHTWVDNIQRHWEQESFFVKLVTVWQPGWFYPQPQPIHYLIFLILELGENFPGLSWPNAVENWGIKVDLGFILFPYSLDNNMNDIIWFPHTQGNVVMAWK